MEATIIVASLVAALCAFVIYRNIKNKKSGKGGCSCGGNCGACGFGCHMHQSSQDASDTETNE